MHASLRLEKLHEVIQAAFGWTNSHLHVFEVGDERIGVPYELEDIATSIVTRSARIVTLADLVDLGFTRFTYEYDFGDSWRHTIEVEEVRPDGGEDDEWARCLDGARACPPEDCGGVDGYGRLLRSCSTLCTPSSRTRAGGRAASNRTGSTFARRTRRSRGWSPTDPGARPPARRHPSTLSTWRTSPAATVVAIFHSSEE